MRNYTKKVPVLKNCPVCGNEFPAQQEGKKFCSRSCQRRHESRKTNARRRALCGGRFAIIIHDPKCADPYSISRAEYERWRDAFPPDVVIEGA